MNEESMKDARLHRYFDGDLSAEEAAEVRRALEADPALRAKLEGLREVRAVVRGSVAIGLRAEPVPSDDLWSRIEASIDAPAAEKAGAPALRAIEGGRKASSAGAPSGAASSGAASSAAESASPELRRRRIAGIVVGALALAAAVLLLVIRPGEPPGATDGEPSIAEGPTEAPGGAIEGLEEAPTAGEEVARTEVLEVDFGDNSGAIFSVEGDHGETYAVVWLADVQPKRTSVE